MTGSLEEGRPRPKESLAAVAGLGDDTLTLAEAARLLPRIEGRKISISTIFRWTQRGLRGVRLSHLRIGRRIVTSHSALLEFFNRLSELDELTPPDTRSRPKGLRRRPITSRQRQRALADADEVLKKAGL
jgi:hypothetical protein